MYDLKLIPIHHQQGKPIPQRAGFMAFSPPRRAARSRSEDLLIVSFLTQGDAPFAPEIQETWLTDLGQAFYKTSGSVTSALRSLIETLNLTMMERNLKNAQDGPAITGAVNLAAVHRHAIYIAQSGLTHAFTLTQGGCEHFFDSSETDRGLGLSRTPTIRYYQADLGDGGYLFLTSTPADTWTEDQLCKDGIPNLEQLRRRLLNQASPNVRLDLVQILPGEGQITTMQPPLPAPEKINDQPESVPSDELPQPERIEMAESVDVSPAPDISDTQKLHQEPAQEAPLPSEDVDLSLGEPMLMAGLSDKPQEIPHSKSEVQQVTPQTDPAAEAETVAAEQPPESEHSTREPKTHQQRVPINEQLERLRTQGLQGLAKFFDGWRQARVRMGTFFKGLLPRIGFTAGEGLSALPNQTLLLIAVAVPLVVTGLAAGVYLSRGRTLQFQYYLEQAELVSTQAAAETDPNLAREGLSQSLLLLESAESFRQTDEIAELRQNIQRAIDRLDGAVRLTYHPAIIGALYDQINITRIISYGLDLYMLDAAGGRVIHATRSSQGYQVDAAFVCSAGNFSGGAVDSLVDMVAMPVNNPYQAHIMAADAIGNVVFCGPEQEPVVQSLPRGEVPLGEVKRIASEGNLLYILDPAADTVHIYRATNGQYLDAPSNFFQGAAEGEKPSLIPMVDLAVNGTELYLLRGDGMLVSCIASGLPGNPVNCENPVTYVDGRPGYEDQPVLMPESRFVSVLYTAPPDPAVSILDADNADIFRYSLRFRLHQRLRSDFGEYEITSPTATAFTIGIDRIAYIAFGHQVFYAYVE